MARAPQALFREEEFGDLSDADTVKRFLRLLNGFTGDTRGALAKGLTLGDNSAAFWKTLDYTPRWIAPTLLNSWVNYGSPQDSAGYHRDAAGRVHFRGTVKNGTIGSVVFVVPAGYRPSGRQGFATICGAPGDTFAVVLIDSNGNVTLPSASNTYYYLDGISFRAEDTPSFASVLKFKNDLPSRPRAVLIAEAHDAVTKVPVALGSPAWTVSGDQILVGDPGGPAGRKLTLTFLVIGG
jgi:hypothetical protein